MPSLQHLHGVSPFSMQGVRSWFRARVILLKLPFWVLPLMFGEGKISFFNCTLQVFETPGPCSKGFEREGCLCVCYGIVPTLGVW